MRPLKMWIGNYDGRREALVIAPTKKRAMEILNTSASNFNNYYSLQTEIDEKFKPETLYTRTFRYYGSSFVEGLCEYDPNPRTR